MSEVIPEVHDEQYIIYSAKRFLLIYEPDYDYKDENAGPYQIVNKTTGIIEFQTTVLAGCLEMLLKFELGMDTYEKQLKEIIDPSPTQEALSAEESARATLHLIRRNLNLPPINMEGYRTISSEDKTITPEDLEAFFSEGPDDDESTH